MSELAPLIGTSVRGIAACVPINRQATADCPAFTSAEDASRFAAAMGISERRIARAGQCASDLCAFAAEALLKKLGWDRSSIGILVMITQSPDYGIPATGILLQNRLGLSVNTIAFDINLGCSAFPFGLAQIASTMHTLRITRGILLIGDISSRSCNHNDPSSYPLFGDAGSAVALELNDMAKPLLFDLHSDGSGGGAILVKSSSLVGRHPISPKSLEVNSCGDDGHPRSDLNIRLNGADIFSFSIQRAPESIRRILDMASLRPADFDYLVLHQANKMINEMICRKSGFRAVQAMNSLEHFGNTGSASIPVTLCSKVQRIDKATRILACGFGVGLSWGSVILEVDPDTPLFIMETDDVFRPGILIDL
jgi:3-oxoacyl-[acyl-carrier-protein] synthase-3